MTSSRPTKQMVVVDHRMYYTDVSVQHWVNIGTEAVSRAYESGRND